MSIFSQLRIFAGAIALLAATTGAAPAAEISAVRFGVTSATETRIVLDADSAPEYTFTIQPDDYNGFSVEIPGGQFAVGVKPTGRGVGQVATFEALSNPKALRVKFGLADSVRVANVFVIPPSKANPRHRLVIDLAKAASGALAASMPARKFETMAEVIEAVSPPANPAGAKVEETVPFERPPDPVQPSKPVIVIDAGHGGSDPGAAGPSGAKESAVTLAAAQALAETLEKSGRYEVVLTRETDQRLAHQERSRIARDAKASLFISLHADAHSNAKVRGGSVYTLSDEGTERSAREALETGDYIVYDLDLGSTGKEVGGILYNLAQRDTANASDRFAEILIAKLAGVTPLLNNTHRRGNFKVLLAPDVPAVLLELAFISNKSDESNLQSQAWRKRSMGAAAAAIDDYFDQKAAVTHASNAKTASTR